MSPPSAAQLGLNTAIVEKRGALGGTCLNVGASRPLLLSARTPMKPPA